GSKGIDALFPPDHLLTKRARRQLFLFILILMWSYSSREPPASASQEPPCLFFLRLDVANCGGPQCHCMLLPIHLCSDSSAVDAPADQLCWRRPRYQS